MRKKPYIIVIIKRVCDLTKSLLFNRVGTVVATLVSSDVKSSQSTFIFIFYILCQRFSKVAVVRVMQFMTFIYVILIYGSN